MIRGKISAALKAELADYKAERFVDAMIDQLYASFASRLAALEADRAAMTREIFQVHVRRFEALENKVAEAISRGPLTAAICKECFASLPDVGGTVVKGGV